MKAVYIYKVVLCKGCGLPLDVEYLGPAVNSRIAGTIGNPGLVGCGKCGECHEYFDSDTRYTLKDCPPLPQQQAV